MNPSNGVSTNAPPIEARKYYGVLIVAPPDEPERYYDLDREVLRLVGSAECEILLEAASVNDCEAIVLCDEGGVSLINTSARNMINVVEGEQFYAQLLPGNSILLKNNSRITLGTTTITIRLAPLVVISEAEAPWLAEQLEMTLTPPACVAVAGETTELQLVVVNQSQRVVSVVLGRALVRLLRIPDDWIDWSEIELRKDKARDSVNPGESLRYSIRLLTPVLHSFSPDQEYSFGISATVREKRGDALLLQEDRQEVKPALANVRFAPFIHLVTEISQTKVTTWHRGVYELKFNNQSNVQLPLTIQARDTENHLRLRLPREDITDGLILLQPNKERTIRVRLGRRGWWPIGRRRKIDGALVVAVDYHALDQELNKLKRKALVQLDPSQRQPLERAISIATATDIVRKPASYDVTLITQPIPWWVPLLMLVILAIGLLLAYPQIPATVAHIITRRSVVTTSLIPLRQSVHLSGLIVPAAAQPLSFARSGTFSTTQGIKMDDCPAELGLATGMRCTYVTAGLPIAHLDTTELEAAKTAALARVNAAKEALAATNQQQQRDRATATAELAQMMQPQAGVHLLNPNDVLSPTVVISPTLINPWFPQHTVGQTAAQKLPPNNSVDLAVELDPQVQAALRTIQQASSEGADNKVKALEEQNDAEAELGLRVAAKLNAQADFNKAYAKLKNSNSVTETQTLGQMRQAAFDAVRALDASRLRVAKAVQAVDNALAQDKAQVNAAIAGWLDARTQARQRIEATRQKVDALEKGRLGAAKQAVDDAEAARVSIQLQIDASEMKAPDNGWIIASDVAPGAAVSAGTPVLIFVKGSRSNRPEAAVIIDLPPEAANLAYDHVEASIYPAGNAAHRIRASYQPFLATPALQSQQLAPQAQLIVQPGAIPFYTPVQAEVTFFLPHQANSLILPTAAVQGQDDDRSIVVRQPTRLLGWLPVNLDNHVPVRVEHASEGLVEVTVHPTFRRICDYDIGSANRVTCTGTQPPFDTYERVVLP